MPSVVFRRGAVLYARGNTVDGAASHKIGWGDGVVSAPWESFVRGGGSPMRRAGVGGKGKHR